MSYQSEFYNMPILGWAIDDWEQFENALRTRFSSNKEINDYISNYKKEVFDKQVVKLYESAPIKLNLGGTTEKSRLVATDRPTGIFDFSLASQGLYRVVEYYSEELAQSNPDKFKDLGLVSGVIPADLVSQKVENGIKSFYYADAGVEYPCTIRQKGETAIEEGVQGAKLKFATKNKKVYLTYKKNRGKVKYVEIYSLFYYSKLAGDIQYAIRHIPAMMVAEYLESIGVQTRFYMTRFVRLSDVKNYRLREENKGFVLPMYEQAKKNNIVRGNEYSLFVQPIIAKDFGEEIDKARAFCISSRNFESLYETIARYAQFQEVETDYSYTIYGDPDWREADYYEGFDRYRNKYQEYVKQGVFKSKEVLPEAMIFFHDLVLNEELNEFCETISPNRSDLGNKLIDVNINPFFAWWMKLSAINGKNKINIINSDALGKDLDDMRKEIIEMVDMLDYIIRKTPDDVNTEYGLKLKVYFEQLGKDLLEKYGVLDKNRQLTFKNYILKITLELTTYAEGDLYATPKEVVEQREELLGRVFEAIAEI